MGQMEMEVGVSREKGLLNWVQVDEFDVPSSLTPSDFCATGVGLAGIVAALSGSSEVSAQHTDYRCPRLCPSLDAS